MTRLTLHLTPLHIRTVDWIMSGDETYRRDDRHRRDAIADILLDYARELRHAGGEDGAVPRDDQQLRDEFDAIRRQRDEAVDALATEREAVANLRGKLAAARRSLDNALATLARLRESRARYRNLAVRAEAAILGSPPREDFGGIDRRLERALRKAGFDMPGISRRTPAVPERPRGHRGGAG